jgi:predicted nuclease with TOPRIM domain
MSTEVLERFPKTVSACHAEILKLRRASENGDGERVKELEAEVEELTEKLADAEKENDKLEDRVEELEEAEKPDALRAIDEFLFEVERPVGQFKFDVIHGPSADRAILGLYAAAGREP